MKKIIFLSVAAALTCSLSFAKVWRINNSVGVAADFTTAQLAHDNVNVQAGDTLYFEHSGLQYGDLTMTKSLKLIGTGAFLQANPGLQYSTDAAALANVVIRPTAAGTLVSVGCQLLMDSASNVLVTRCRITGTVSFYATSNCTVSNCFVEGGINMLYTYLSNPCGVRGCTGLSIFNNILRGSITQDVIGVSSVCVSGQTFFPHNVVVFNNSVAPNSFIKITGSVYNNIAQFYQVGGSTFVSNNISYASIVSSSRITYDVNGNTITTEMESGSGNLYSQPSASIYASGPGGIDTSFRLKPVTSVALAAGTGGVDCGATGGSAAFKFGMLPAIPAIYKLNVAPAANGNSIGVTISTRSNN